MDGIEATKRIRVLEQSHLALPRQFIMGVSANSDGDTSDEALLAGMNIFVPKPFQVEVFQQRIAEHLALILKK